MTSSTTWTMTGDPSIFTSSSGNWSTITVAPPAPSIGGASGTYVFADTSMNYGGVGIQTLLSRLDKIEERLGIIQLNTNLEDKWNKLKQLGNEYRALEKDLLEKEKIWEILGD